MNSLDKDFPPLPVSRKPSGVYAKLMQARLELQGRKLSKSGHNKFAGYQYFELGDFLPVVQDIFASMGLCGVISYGKEEAWLTITDTDDGSSIAICSPMSSAALKGCHEVQNLGAVQTYIRRYLWVTALEIVEHDALDATTGKDKPAKTEPKKYSASGSGIKEEAYDTLDKEGQAWVNNVAYEVTTMFNEGTPVDGLIAHLREALGPTPDQQFKLAIWHKLDSKIRTFIDSKEKGIRAAA